MIVSSNNAASSHAGRPVWPLQVLAAYFVGLRLWFDVTVPPMGDEAYYWIWGQHLQWSYFDHPPLDAWAQGLVAALFGWSPVTLRLLTWLTLAGSLAILWAWSKRFQPDDRRSYFWMSSLVYLTLPVIVLSTTPAFHDHLLVFLCLAASYAFLEFATRWQDGDRRPARLYLAALLLGLAALTKYNGILLGLGLTGHILATPRLRSLLRTPHPYLAAVLTLAVLAPVIYWNLVENFASLKFHFVDRPSGHWSRPDMIQAVKFLLMIALPLGPFVLLGLFRLPFVRATTPYEADARRFSLIVFGASTLVMSILAMFTEVLLHWNIVAYLALVPIGYRLLGTRWLFWPHVALSVYLATVAMWNYSVAPIRVFLFSDPGTAANYGWDEVAEEVRQASIAHPSAFLAATRYTYAAQLGFQLHDANVTAFNPLPSQYDLWWRPDLQQGRDAIIVADKLFPIDFAAGQFRAMTKLSEVGIARFGKTIWNFDIYLGEGYAPPN